MTADELLPVILRNVSLSRTGVNSPSWNFSSSGALCWMPREGLRVMFDDPEPDDRPQRQISPLTSDVLAVLAAAAFIGMTVSFYWIDHVRTAATDSPPATVGQR